MTLRDTDLDWTDLAETNPYWAVLSDNAFKGTTLDEASRTKFFRSGEEQIARLLGFIKRHLQADFTPERALDFGCGVGRLLLPLARIASEAVGVDIAPRMIELCRESLTRAALHNATVVLSDDTLSGVRGRFSLVNTVIVLQHIPPERGYALLARLIDLLDIGGVGSIQLTYAKERRFMVHEATRARYFRRDGRVLHDLSPTGAPTPPGSITMYDYDLNQVMLMLAECAGHPLLVLPTHDDGHAGTHFIFRRAR